MNSSFQSFSKKITSPLNYFLYTMKSLPAAYFCGVRIESLQEDAAIVSIKQKWFNKNPFRSIYFAALGMAAEMSTGLLVMGHNMQTQNKVSIIVTTLQGSFIKKATGKILFTCSEGKQISECVNMALATGEALSITCHSTGTNENNETVATFEVTWSFKLRK